MTVPGTRVFAFGSGASGTGVYRFDGAAWQLVGTTLPSGIRDLVVADDGSGEKLYALDVATLQGVPVPSRVTFRLESGQWAPFGAAMPTNTAVETLGARL